jgi:hypothetical protein
METATAVNWQSVEAALTRFLERDETDRRNRATAKARRAMQKELGGIFTEQGEDFVGGLAAIQDKVTDGSLAATDWLPYFNQATSATRQALERLIFNNVLEALILGGGRLVDDLDLPITISFGLDNPRAVAYAMANAAEKVTQINDATREMINRTIVNAITDGTSWDNTAKELTSLFKEMTRGRAERIARYELGSGYEQGKKLAAQEMAAEGLTMEKKVVTAGDDRVRPSHRDNETAGWIGMDETFPSGDDVFPSDPGCRCSVIWRVARN